MLATMLVPRARDEENHFSCSLNEADQYARFLSIGGYRNVINNSNKVLLIEFVHRGVYVSRELSLLRYVRLQERLNKPMERKMCLYTRFRSVSFPRKSRA